MSDSNENPRPAFAQAAGYVPTAPAIGFVRRWLWESESAETAGMPWTREYVHDAARMLDAYMREHNHRDIHHPMDSDSRHTKTDRSEGGHA